MNVVTLSKSFLLDSRFAIFGQTSVRKYWMENVRSVRRIWRNIGHQRHRTFRPSNAFFELQKFTHFRFGINFLGLISNNFLYSCEFWILFQDKRLIPMMVFLPKFPYLLSLHFWWIRSHLKFIIIQIIDIRRPPENSDCQKSYRCRLRVCEDSTRVQVQQWTFCNNQHLAMLDWKYKVRRWRHMSRTLYSYQPILYFDTFFHNQMILNHETSWLYRAMNWEVVAISYLLPITQNVR